MTELQTSKSKTEGESLIAQKNTVAYEVPEPPTEKKRGRKRIYGDKVSLYARFADPSTFQTTIMNLYGKKTKVRYLCLDLIWKPVKRLVRFVLVISDRGNCVLMSSDLTLSPEEIISLYAMRFKIETSFDEQKNDLGCFAYHFWTRSLPKRRKWKPVPNPASEDQQMKVAKTKQAINAFVCLGSIATGIMTLIAFSHNREIWNRYPGWVKILRSSVPTIATVKLTLAQDFHAFLPHFSSLLSFSFIPARLRHDDFFFKSVA